MCALTEVLTLSEVAELWHYHKSTVLYHLNKGHFRWRDTYSGYVLIERQSVVDYWGDAPCTFEVYERIPERKRRKKSR